MAGQTARIVVDMLNAYEDEDADLLRSLPQPWGL